MTHKIILLNGPPRSGKDTAAEYLLATLPSQKCPPQHLKFAEPLKAAVPAMYGISKKRWDFLYNEAKDDPVPDLLGLSVREAMINASEDWLKVSHGPKVFGQLALQKIKQMKPGTIVVSDCGFYEEVVVLCDALRDENVLIVQIHRKGCSFKHDSRSYIDIDGVKRVKVKNNGSVADFQREVLGVCLDWLGGVR